MEFTGGIINSIGKEKALLLYHCKSLLERESPKVMSRLVLGGGLFSYIRPQQR